MKTDVPDAVRKETTKCEHAFSCLETGKCGDHELCPAEYVDGERVIVLRSPNRVTCPYRTTLGEMQLCRCPTYYAILKDRERRLDASYAAQEEARKTANLADTIGIVHASTNPQEERT